MGSDVIHIDFFNLRILHFWNKRYAMYINLEGKKLYLLTLLL